MNLLKSALQESLRTGFIDQIISSNKAFRPQLLVNDKSAGKKVLTTIERELKNCEEFWFSVAFITTSGVATLMNALEVLEKKGVPGKILASQYLNFTQPEALRRLMQFKNIELRIVTNGDFHSKGYLFKKGELFDLIIGSSNLTANALCSNKEWNLKVTAAEPSEIIKQSVKEFTDEFAKATVVTKEWLIKYDLFYRSRTEYNKKIQAAVTNREFLEIEPNLMQKEALNNLKYLRHNGKKKALLISATGTGKTYLSAFDVKDYQPNKFLFLVHRQNIAKKAMETYRELFGEQYKMGLYSGNKRELDADYIFSTIQTLSRDEHLKQFAKNHFNYVVIDETHRAGAHSYQKIIDYLDPDFLLGMTATPERTDGYDVFKLFEYNIAYEIRLHGALDSNMLSPFHYYGVTDLSINGQVIEDKSDFNQLIAEERVNRIIEAAKKYGCDNGNVRGLVFCSKKDEAHALSKLFNQRHYETIALTGDDTEEKRSEAIRRIESNLKAEKLDYIFTVDIFNEGIDIPSINQIIMLRPTQSSIIFVQQLGRGLRKTNNKEYLTVIDFIGNYNKNFLVPIALYGDTSYNKDTLRNLISTGSQLMPGTSTINFDEISKKKIFEAIDSANLQTKKDLINDYKLLKFKLGRIPTLLDFFNHGSRDPFSYVSYSKSYYNFLVSTEESFNGELLEEEERLLSFFSTEINNSKRIEETLLLELLIKHTKVSLDEFQNVIRNQYGYELSQHTIKSCLANLNFEFVTQKFNKQLLSVGAIYGIRNVQFDGVNIWLDDKFLNILKKIQFRSFLMDSINCAKAYYNSIFHADKFLSGFQLYRKYSRKDVFRILNWPQNPVAQNVGGYIVSKDKRNCPIFVNYHKEDSISKSTMYEDRFLSNQEFQWMSKNKRTLNSSDVKTIRDHRNGLRIPLFIKKSNDEGNDFYYMGDVFPIDDSFIQTSMDSDNGKAVSVVQLIFQLSHAVEDHLFDYLTDQD